MPKTWLIKVLQSTWKPLKNSVSSCKKDGQIARSPILFRRCHLTPQNLWMLLELFAFCYLPLARRRHWKNWGDRGASSSSPRNLDGCLGCYLFCCTRFSSSSQNFGYIQICGMTLTIELFCQGFNCYRW